MILKISVIITLIIKNKKMLYLSVIKTLFPKK